MYICKYTVYILLHTYSSIGTNPNCSRHPVFLVQRCQRVLNNSLNHTFTDLHDFGDRAGYSRKCSHPW